MLVHYYSYVMNAEEHGSHRSDGFPQWLTVAYSASFCCFSCFSKMLTSENSAQTLCGTVTRCECKANGYKYLTKVQTTTKILLRDSGYGTVCRSLLRGSPN